MIGLKNWSLIRAITSGKTDGRNEAIPNDYFDDLDQVELVDETAIDTSDYRTFLSRNFLRLWIEWHDRPATKQMTTEERRDQFETYVPYNHAKRTLHGKVLYFFLAGEIVMDFQYGLFNIGEHRWAEFLQDNPYPEYTEVVEEVVREASKIKTRPARARLHPQRPPRPKRLPERFQRPSGFLGLLGELVRSLHRGSTPSKRAQTADPRPEGGLFEHLFGPRRRVAPSSR